MVMMGIKRILFRCRFKKESSYLSDKMHLEKVIGKNVMKTYNRAPEKGGVIIVSKYINFWNLYRKRILLISIMTIFNEKKIRPRPRPLI
jgi:hypothetical protein